MLDKYSVQSIVRLFTDVTDISRLSGGGSCWHPFNDVFPTLVNMGPDLRNPPKLRWVHRFHGFESRTSLIFFSDFLFATAKVAYITAMIFYTFNSLFGSTNI